MKRLKDDEIRFRRALAASGKRIEDVDLDDLAEKSKVSPKRARHFARTLAGPKLPELPVQQVAETKGEDDGDVHG